MSEMPNYSKLQIEMHRDAYFARYLYAVFGTNDKGRRLRLSPYFKTREGAQEILIQLKAENE